MKTAQEILDHINEVEGEDFLGFEVNDLVAYLPFEHVKTFVKEGTTAEQWAEIQKDNKTPAETIKSYMPFAWDKANNCRGISASRSISHMKAWAWLDGNDDLYEKIKGDYEFYGKPQLALISHVYGVNWEVLDNGEWVNGEDEPGVEPEFALAKFGYNLN